LAWLPAPSGPVLASLPKCASHAHFTLLHINFNILITRRDEQEYTLYLTHFRIIVEIRKCLLWVLNVDGL
jgi:hypothetical protein